MVNVLAGELTIDLSDEFGSFLCPIADIKPFLSTFTAEIFAFVIGSKKDELCFVHLAKANGIGRVEFMNLLDHASPFFGTVGNP